MPDFDAIYSELRAESRIPDLLNTMTRAIDDLTANAPSPPAVKAALNSIREQIENARSVAESSYLDDCVLLWTLKFYRVAIGSIVLTAEPGQEFLATAEAFEKELQKSVRPQLMRKTTASVISSTQLEALRQLPEKEQLSLPGRREG